MGATMNHGLFARVRRRALGVLFAGACLATSGAPLADDSADEADLLFRVGAEAYQRGDLRNALQHFLASNRLVPNRNVVYNIARTYEKLGSYPEAYRYYTQALEDETDEATITSLRAALKRLGAYVTVISVSTEPPGATIYVDRKDLGPRGATPRALGLAPGSYTVIIELPGYETERLRVEDAAVGKEAKLALELKPILGTVKVEGPATGAAVRVGSAEGEVACLVPCALELPPGPHTLYLSRAGFRPGQLQTEVKARRATTVEASLDPLMGTLVASTDEPGALVEVNGKPRGFTPAIVSLPVGTHEVRISRRGFRESVETVRIEADRQTRVETMLAVSEEVVAASRTVQTVEDAPASVTIIAREEIAALDYPTIAEAARGVRGFYTWDDRAYVTLGVRGVGRTGSYGNRQLVLFDGQPTNDNWVGSSYVGFDGLISLDDVERLEFVRGPGSVVYGTGAFSGVVNVVTRDRGVPQGVRVGIGTALDGVARARVRGDYKFGKDSGIWTSVAAARSDGREFRFAEIAAEDPSRDAGVSRGADGFETASVHGRAYSGDYTLQWFANVHEKHLPTGAYDTLLGDPRMLQRDTRFILEAKAEPELAAGFRLLSRVHGAHYRFRGVYPRDEADGGVERDTYRGAWVGLEERATWDVVPALRLTLGGEAQHHFLVEQRARDATGYFLGTEEEPDAHPYQVAAGYGVVDVELGSKVRLSSGARYDYYSTFGGSLNPRAALIVEPYDRGNTKLIASKAFRAPSIYELYYNDDGYTQTAAGDLEPEVIYSAELEHSHRFSPSVRGTVSAYANYIEDIVSTEGAGDATDPFRYINSGSPLVVVGTEVSVRRDFRQGLMLSASYGFSRARFLADDSASSLFELAANPEKREVENAPEHRAVFTGAVPIVNRALTAGTRLTFEAARYDRHETVGEPPQEQTEPAVIWDVVLSGAERRHGLRYAFGVYNAFDWQYSLPVSSELRQRTIRQSGRTFHASAEVAF
jgi:outer membrane receptor protein involved in Fe transport